MSSVLANQGSSLLGARWPIAYSALNAESQQLFDAQLDAWRAGCALAAASAQATIYGAHVPGDMVREWLAKRDEYEFQRECARERKTVERLTQRH